MNMMRGYSSGAKSNEYCDPGVVDLDLSGNTPVSTVSAEKRPRKFCAHHIPHGVVNPARIM